MDWKKEYKNVIENICKKEIAENDTIYEIDPPSIFFNGKTYESDEKGLITKRLIEDVADENDYREFCEYAYQKIGKDVEENKRFTNFGKEK